MSEEKKPIQKLYDDPKSRGFVNHLIVAYLPIYKVQKVWEFEDKKPHKCNVCNHDLIDAGTVMGRMLTSEEYPKAMIDEMRKGLSGEEIKYEDRAIIKHITHGAIMAWQGEKTTTFLCQDCIKDLLDLVTNGLLMGDKNITWIVNKNKRATIFNQFKQSPSLNTEEKQQVEKIQKVVEKKKVATFADLNVLQQLKDKMVAEEKAFQEANENKDASKE